METVHLQFPAVVSALEYEGGATRYRVRPLLAGPGSAHLQSEENSYERALEKLRLTVSLRLSFLPLGPKRDDLDEILVFGFSPILDQSRFDLAFESGGEFVEGSFTAVWFDLQGLRYVVLPGFDHHMFIARQPSEKKYKMSSEVERVVKHLLRRERLEAEGPPPDPSTHFSPRKEFLIEVGTPIPSAWSQYSFEPGLNLLLLNLGEQEKLDGRVELERTAKNLNRHFPSGLMRARFREPLVHRVQEALFGESDRPLVLMGEAGVGKSAVLQEALQRYLEAFSETWGAMHLHKARQVWELDPARVIAGMSMVGMWQRRFEAILECCRKTRKSKGSVLYVSNPVALLRLGKSAQTELTLADVLRSHLEDPSFPVILETTPGEWLRVQEMDRGFGDLFEIIRVPELSRAEAWEVTARSRAGMERQGGALFHSGALVRLKDLLKVQGPPAPMPSRAIRLLERLSSRHRGGWVQFRDVDRLFREQTGLREDMANPDAVLEWQNVDGVLGRRLVGQPEALRCLVDTVMVIKAQLADPERPYGAFLFVGPTGVGKTEAAKVLTEYLFGDPDRLLRFDMNEYVDPGALARLIGDGHRPEGQLTSAVRFRPFSVLLLDEIEKAHPDVHDALLQVLDDGRLTDGAGRTVDFTRTVIIMTSNVGAGEAQATAGFDASERDRRLVYRAAAKRHFRPELFNRIHRVIAFQPLGLEEASFVARLQMRRLLQRDGFLRRGTVLSVSQEALRWVAAAGFDPDMGGRSIKRAVERSLAGIAAEKLVSLPADAPIVLEIRVRQGSLHPRVIPLHMVTGGTHAFPFRPPTGKEDRRASYVRLAELAESLRDSLLSQPGPARGSWVDEPGSGEAAPGSVEGGRGSMEGETGSPAGPAVGAGGSFASQEIDTLLLRDRLTDLLGDLQEILLDPVRAPNKFVRPFRVRSTSESLRAFWKRSPSQSKLFAELDVREYLRSVYEEAHRAFQEGDAEILSLYERLANLWLRRPIPLGERADGPESTGVCLHIRSLSDESVASRRDFLLSCYREVLHLVDPDLGDTQDECTPREEVYLGALGRGLFPFCLGETGTHLFMEPDGGLLPVQVRVLSLGDGRSFEEVVRGDQEARRRWLEGFEAGSLGEEQDPFAVGPVLRLYVAPARGEHGTITDLRTNLAGEYKKDPQAWFTWMHSALPPELHLPLGCEP